VPGPHVAAVGALEALRGHLHGAVRALGPRPDRGRLLPSVASRGRVEQDATIRPRRGARVGLEGQPTAPPPSERSAPAGIRYSGVGVTPTVSWRRLRPRPEAASI